MILRALPIASAPIAIALADICGAYSLELANTLTRSRTLYFWSISITISNASYIFLPNSIQSATGAAPDHPSHPSTVIKSSHLLAGRSDIALMIHSTLLLCDITTFIHTGLPPDFSDTFSKNSKNSLCFPCL